MFGPWPLVLSDEVRGALQEGRPVVALESTLITHGLPAPDNLEVALGAEHDVRAGARCRRRSRCCPESCGWGWQRRSCARSQDWGPTPSS